MKYQVKNCPEKNITTKYTVIRECKDGYWYYGGYNDLYRASLACNEIGNGRITETENVEPIRF